MKKWKCQFFFEEAVKYEEITFYSVSKLEEIHEITETTIIYVPKEQSQEYI